MKTKEKLLASVQVQIQVRGITRTRAILCMITVRHPWLIDKAKELVKLGTVADLNAGYCVVLKDVIEFGLAYCPDAKKRTMLLSTPPTSKDYKKLLAKDARSFMCRILGRGGLQDREIDWMYQGSFDKVRFLIEEVVVLDKAAFLIENNVTNLKTRALNSVIDSFINYYVMYCPSADKADELWRSEHV